MRRALRASALVASSTLVTLFLYEEVLHDVQATGWGDYQEYHHLWESAWIAMTRYGEWPLWNPFQCGGITQYGNPQTQVFHPLFYLSLLLRPTVALKVFLLVHATAGVAGAYLVARSVMRQSIPASALVAVGWAGSGYFAWHCGTGHANFIAFYLTPWIVYGWRRAMRDVRWGMLVGLVMSLAVLAGGVYAFPFFVFLVAHEAAWALRARTSRRRVIPVGALAVVVTVLVGGVRLIPILADLQHHPRDQISVDYMDPGMLLRALTVQDLTWPMPPIPGHPWLWVEYSQYIGWPILALAIYGAVLAARRRGARWLLSGALLFGLLTMGNFAAWAPWTWIHRLPIYDSLKVPSRFGVLMLLHVALLAGLGVDGIARRVRELAPRRPRAALYGAAIASAIALLGIADVSRMHRAALDGKWRDPPISRSLPLPYFVATRPEARLGAGEDENPVPAWFPQLNLGSGYCYSGMRYHGALGLWQGPLPQVRTGPGVGRLLDEGHTTSTVWAVVEVPQPSLLTFNRTWAPDWVSNYGRVERDSLERMTVVVPPGHHRVVLEYRPPTLAPALLATLLGLLLCVIVVRLGPDKAGHPLAVLAYAVILAASLYVYFDLIALPAQPGSASFSARAVASGEAEDELNDWYEAANVVDSDPASEWHLPDGQPGWIDLRLEEPRTLSWITLLNSRNAPHRDRATVRARVTAFLGDQAVSSSRVIEVPRRWEGRERWAEVYLPAWRADRIRVEILEWEGLSGGLAEINVLDLPYPYDPVGGVDASSAGEAGAAAAHDRRMSTRWTPRPEDPAPWVELRLKQAQRVSGLFVRRADRAAPRAELRIELFFQDELVVVRRGFLGAGRRAVMVPLDAPRAERVRVHFEGPAAATIDEVGVY